MPAAGCCAYEFQFLFPAPHLDNGMRVGVLAVFMNRKDRPVAGKVTAHDLSDRFAQRFGVHGQQTHAIFIVLNLFGNADNHALPSITEIVAVGIF